MILTNQDIKNITKRLIMGYDYRIVVVSLINDSFLHFALGFFQKIVESKLNNQKISTDWYKKTFLDEHLPSKDIAINSGLNEKTIFNMFNTKKKSIVLDASQEHYELLCKSIKDLIDEQNDVDLTLTIKLRGVSIELDINESLVVINTLAVKRSALRGGAWSTTGKQVEKLLVLTLCALYKVPQENFTQEHNPDSIREVDYFLTKEKKKLRCEVKLMGKGNPESADAIFARESDVFIADKLSDLNKKQADEWNVRWVELRATEGYKRFEKVLEHYDIPFTKFTGDLQSELDKILDELLHLNKGHSQGLL